MRVIVPQVLSATECAETIAAAEQRGFEQMGLRYPDQYRNNDRAVLDDAALAAALFERLEGRLPPVWEEEGARWKLKGLNARFRFCRYRDGQQFTRHRDGAWSPNATERSWLTVMVYLNDAGGFEGGATRFYDGPEVEAVPPRLGQAIIFDHRSWHDGAPVTKGTKYVMRTDVMYELEQAAAAPRARASGVVSCERVLEGHTGYVWTVRQLSDGRLVSGSRDCTVRDWGRTPFDTTQVSARAVGSITALLDVEGRLWVGGRHGRLDDGRRNWQAHEGAILGLERRADGSVVSCGADGAVRRWSPTGEACGELARHAGWVWGLAVDGERLRVAVDPVTAVTIGCAGARDGRLTLDDGRSWQAHEGTVTAVAALGERWLSAGEDGAVRVWSATGELLGEGWHRDFVRGLAPLGEGRFASCSYDGTVELWRCQDPPPDATVGR